MTSETHVTLETARLLKRAGFDWKCECRYVEGRPVRSYPPKNVNTLSADVCSMPTQAVAARWLRERKGISVDIQAIDAQVHLGMYQWRIVLLQDFDGSMTEEWFELASYYRPQLFPNYETALENGLREVLIILNNPTNE